MDILAREKAMLEVKQSSTLLLLPNSITIRPYPADAVAHPMSTHRITLDIKYATTMFSVMVTMENPLDFLITTPHLLPMKYLDDKPFPPGYPNTSLVELVNWLISQLRSNMVQRIQAEERMSGFVTAIENLMSLDILTKESYELAIVEDKVTFLVKFRPEKEIKLHSLTEIVKEDKLLNTGGHFYVLKLVFRVDTGAFLPGEFSVAFSSDLSMLPELASFSQPGLTAKLATDLVEFLVHVKDTVDQAIVSAVAGWEARSRLLLHLFSIFDGGVLGVPYLDSHSMSVMDLAFRAKESKCLLKIELGADFPQVVPKVTIFTMVLLTEGARETRGSGGIKEFVLKDSVTGFQSNMDDSEIVEIVLKLINKIAEKF